MAGIKFDITSDNKNLLNSVRQAQTGVTNAISGIERAGMGIESTFSKIKGSVLGGFADIAKGMVGLTALLQGGSFIKDLVADAGKFNIAMKEVSTLSEDVANNLQGYKDQVVDMTTQIPIGATEAAKALYQIESAGHHGADGLNVLRESAKGAIGGVTDTATTADAITTILNAYKKGAGEAQHISDLLFTTVRLGKTTMGELGHSMSQVAPVAAAYGVSIEDVLSAVASLTKQGTPTSIAIRQVRDAITATTASLGDAAFQGRNFLDAMDDVAKKSQGSNNALKDDLSKLGAINAVLGLTGKNAASARQDMQEMQNSAGAAEAAYEKMASTAGTQTMLLRNNIFKTILPIANEMKAMSGEIAGYLNEAFDSGAMDSALTSLEAFIAAYAVYKGLVATTAAWNSAALGGVYSAQIAELQTLIPLKELDGQADLKAAVAKGTLTKEQALLVASLRGEVEARYEEIMAAETSARAELKAATAAEAAAQANVVAAEEIFVAAQARMEAATQSGVATEIEAAKEELNTASRLKNTAVTELNTATRQKNGAATMVSVTAKNADTAATLMNTTQQGANATATGVLATAKLQLKKAIDAVNSSFLASPLFWVAAVIAGVTYAVYKLVTVESAHESAIRRTNEAMEEQKKKLDDRKNSIDGLIGIIQDQNATEYQKIKAYNDLKAQASDITDVYSREALAAMNAANAQKIVNQSMDDASFEDTVEQVKEAEKAYVDALNAVESAKKSAEYGYTDTRGDYTGKGLNQAEEELALWRKALLEIVHMREEARLAALNSDQPVEIKVQEAQSNEATKRNILDFYESVVSKVNDLQAVANNINWNGVGKAYEKAKQQYGRLQSEVDFLIADVTKDVEVLQKMVDDNPLDINLQFEKETKKKVLDELTHFRNDIGGESIPLSLEIDKANAQEILQVAQDYTKEVTPIEIRLQEARENEAEKRRVLGFYDDVILHVDDIQSSQNTLNFDEAQNKLNAYINDIQTELADLHIQVEQNPFDQKLQMKEQEKKDLLSKLLQWKQEMAWGGFTNIPLQFKVDWNSAKVALTAAKNYYAELFNQSQNEEQNPVATTLADDFKKAKSEYEVALKEWNRVSNPKNRASVTSEEYNKAKSNLATTKGAFEAVGGDPDGKIAKASAQARKQRQQQQEQDVKAIERYKETLRKQQLKEQRERLDLLYDTRQAEINALRDGSEKTLKQIQLDFEQEKEEIERGYTDLKQSKIDAARALWEANPANKGKTFDESTVNVDYSEEEQKNYDALLKANEAARNRSMEEYVRTQSQAMRDYLMEYGSFYAKQLAITEEYEQKIREAKNEGERLKLQKEFEEVRATLSMEEVTSGIDWRAVFGGVENMTTEMMRTLTDQLRAYQRSDEYKNADADTKRQIADILSEMRQYVGSDRSVTWETLSTAIGNFKTSVGEYKAAMEQEKPYAEAYRAAKEAEDKARFAYEKAKADFASGKITKEEFTETAPTEEQLRQLSQVTQQAREQLDPYSRATANAKRSMEDFGQQVNTASEELKGYVSGLTVALKNVKSWQGVEGFGDVQNAVNSIDHLKGDIDTILPKIGDGMGKDIFSGLSTGIDKALGSAGLGSIMQSGVMQTIGIVAQIPKIILTIADTVKNMVTGILDSFTELFKFEWLSDLVNSILEAVGNLVQAIFDLPANLVNSIGSIITDGVGGLLHSVGNAITFGGLDSWLGNRSNHEDMVHLQEEITTRLDFINDSVSEISDRLAESYGAEAIKTAEDLKDFILTQQTLYNEGVQAAGYDDYEGHHSDWYHWNKNTSDMLQDILREYTQKGYDLMGVGSWQDFFDKLASMEDARGAELLNDLRANHGNDWWYTMQTQGYNEGAIGEWLDKWADSWAEIESAQDKLKEQLTTTTAGNVFSDFMDSIYDLADGSEDVFDSVAENWQAMVNKMVLNNLVGQKYKKQLEDWYNEILSTTYEEGISEDEYKARIEEARRRYDEILQSGADEVSRLRDAGIVQSPSDAKEDKSATNTMADKATYEQFETYLGIATAQQIALEQIKTILERWDGSDKSYDEIRDVIGNFADSVGDLTGSAIEVDPTVMMDYLERLTTDDGERLDLGGIVRSFPDMLRMPEYPAVNFPEQGEDKTGELIAANLQTMNDIASANGSVVREIRNLIGTSNEYLLDIKKSNREILSAMTTRLDNMNNLIEKKL